MEEIWRIVEENPIYMVSNNNGFINTTKDLQHQPFGRIYKGYRIVGLGREVGERKYHYLVAKAFPEICGEWFEGCHIHHINFNKLDNRPENLIVLSHSEHNKLHYQHTSPDSFKKASTKRSKSISKALTGKPSVHKIPIVQLTLDNKIVKEYECLSDVTKDGFSQGNVCSACKGNLKTAYGYIWKYKKDTE